MSHPADRSADSFSENASDNTESSFAEIPSAEPTPSAQPSDRESLLLDEQILDEQILDEQISDEWIPDEWIPKDSAEKSAKSVANRSTQASAQKHSAELFPVPPIATAGSATSSVTNSSIIGAPPSPPAGVAASGAAVPGAGSAVGPLPLVETAFLASAASLMWLINSYFPPGPLLRILFPLPIALIYLRWNLRSAWMAATVSGLLLTILLGPTRSIFFVMPYGFLGVQLGYLWRKSASWELSMTTGAILVSFGTFFRIWLLSLLSGEDLWGYLVAQITQFLDWLVRLLTNWGWVGLGTWGQPSMEFIAIAAVITVLLSNLVYLLTVHIAAWLVLERLRVPMPEPPGWLQALIDE